MPSNVDHPPHYGGAANIYEAIKIIEAHDLGFHLGNAMKYILRAGKKTSDSKEDIEKLSGICRDILIIIVPQTKYHYFLQIS